MFIKRLSDTIMHWRWLVRRQRWVQCVIYMVPNIAHALFARPWREPQCPATARGRVALCLRFRDEARFLKEWLDYYLAAGIEHFFLYNNFSSDNYQDVLQAYHVRGCITCIDWPRKPASPFAEHDCLRRSRGKFEWVVFLDADEFVVVADGRTIPALLSGFDGVPAVALHWYYFGSSGHEKRPQDWVIRAYTQRAASPDGHVKVFVRPTRVTRNRNSHNFYYRRASCAVNEAGQRMYGSVACPGVADVAWINHYYCKSGQDYLEKARRQSTLDRSGIRHPSRRAPRLLAQLRAHNEVFDDRAATYFGLRRDGRQRGLKRHSVEKVR